METRVPLAKLSALSFDPNQLDTGTEQLLRAFYKGMPYSDSKKSLTDEEDTFEKVPKYTITLSPSFHEEYGTMQAQAPVSSSHAETLHADTHDGSVFAVFNIRVETAFGEEVLLVGNIKELGEWNPLRALKLQTTKARYPTWSTTIVIPCSSQPAEYKFIVLKDQSYRWEEFDSNRKLELNGNQGPFLYVDDGCFGKKVESTVFTSNTVDILKKEIEKQQETVNLHQHEKSSVEREMENMKQKMEELEFQSAQLKKQISVLEGAKLDSLSNTDLRTLISKSKKTAHRANVELMKRLENEIYHLQRLKDCAVCMDKQIDTVCLPCGHMALCGDCANRLYARCVICNVKIQKIQKVFMK